MTNSRLLTAKSLIVLCVFLASVVTVGSQWQSLSWPAFRDARIQSEPSGDQAPVISFDFIPSILTEQVHAASLVELEDGMIRAFWYGGTREGAKDVAIWTAVLDPQRHKWTDAQVAYTRHELAAGLKRYIRKLGNPVPVRFSDNRLGLIFVSNSVGGWAMSMLNLVVSNDEGKTWGEPTRMITTPFANLGTLVKGAQVDFEDGSTGLPVYQELAGAYSQVLRLNSDGKVLGLARITDGGDAIQAVVLPSSPKNAVSLMRYRGGAPERVVKSYTSDSGEHWSAMIRTTLQNPNAAVAAVRLDDGRILVVFNDSVDERDNLTLAVGDVDAQSWQVIHVLENEPVAEQKDKRKIEFSYPFLIQTRNGDFHLVYTWHQKKIKHVFFNKAWLESKL